MLSTSIRIGIMTLMSVLTVACAVFGIRSEEEPTYQVFLQDGSIEIRQYESYLVATTTIEDDFEPASNHGFRRLFNYISGANASQQDISMTAPVLQKRVATGEKIAMTAPVLQNKAAQGWTMSFVMPVSYTIDTVPRPTDPAIMMQEIPAATVAVLRYSWRTNPEKISRLEQELMTWIAAQNAYEAISEPRLARYDPPFTLPFLRRSEIHISVRNVAKNVPG